MVKSFQFEDGGRTYTCTLEPSRTAKGQAWWWFGVSGDAQRYAPFMSASGDTQTTVRTRIIEYYNNVLVRRAMPPAPRHHWSGRPKAAVTPPPTEA
ncbi:MAG: hypothetical protein ACR2OG_12420 [Gemmatimonadaceae bacterium]